MAFLAADASIRERHRAASGALDRTSRASPPPVSPNSPALLRAVRAASERDDVVVVYLHWGGRASGARPRSSADRPRRGRAGADVIVGSHAHVLLGSGWLGDTYVSYGLGNFLWYHDHRPRPACSR